MRAARGDIEWGELAVMVFSLLCAVGPVVKWQWSEWKKRERAKEKAKESVRRGKRDVESKLKEQQRLEEEVARRRAAAVRQEESDEEDEDDAADSEERRREKEARRARLKKARTAMKAALLPYTMEEDRSEESKAASDGTTDKLPSEDVELLVRGLTVEALEQLWDQLEAIRADEKRRVADRARAISHLFNEQVGTDLTLQPSSIQYRNPHVRCSRGCLWTVCPTGRRASAGAARSAGGGLCILILGLLSHQIRYRTQ